MTTAMHRHPFDRTNLDELVAFCQEHPITGHPPDLIRRLIGRLPADETDVLDLWLDGQRRMVAVVLDTLDNSDHAAIFDVLGWDRVGTTEDIWPLALDLAEQRVLSGPRDVISVSLGEAIAALWPWLAERGYTLGYTSYGMATPDIPPAPLPFIPTRWRWQPITADTVRAYYDAVCAAMGSLPGTNIAAYEDFAPMALQADLKPTILWDGDQVAGFYRVSLSGEGMDTGYISAIGRTPGYRGQGLGPLLLAKAMHELAAQGAKRYALDVAATNVQALELYRQHGFRIVSQEPHYLKALRP